MSNFISLIIPTFNSYFFIKRTIHSLFEQKDCEIEIIVVDSGSKDGTLEYCKQYADKVLYCPPGNMYSAINLGLKEASHDIVAYINSDDYFFENILSDYLNFFKEKSLDFAYAQGDFVDVNGRFRSSAYCPEPNQILTYFKCGIMPIIQPTVIFKKQLYENLNGFDDKHFKYSADFDFCFRVFNSAAKIGYYKQSIVSFRVTNNQITNSYKDIIANELNYILKSYSNYTVLNKRLFSVKYKIYNILNIVMRSFRSYQLSGKFSISRAISPF